MRRAKAVPVADIPGDLITVAEAAELMGVCGRTIWRYIEAGKVQAFREVSRVKLSRAELEEFMRPKVRTGPAR